MKQFGIDVINAEGKTYDYSGMINSLLGFEYKLEVYRYSETTPYKTHFTQNLNTYFREYFWVDFPTIETFFRVFIVNKQQVFEKLYLDGSGNIITHFVFTKEV